MNKHLFLSLFLVFIYPAALFSQISFERTESDIIFEDRFDDNKHNWYQGEKDGFNAKIESGKYNLKYTGNYRYYLPYKKILNVESTHNFEIESTIQKISGPDSEGYGIIWGMSNSKNFFSFLISGTGRYSYMRVKKGEEQQLIDWEVSKNIRTGNSINKITVIKSEDLIQFCVNDSLICTARFEKLFDKRVGFIVNRNMEIGIDDLSIIRSAGEERSEFGRRWDTIERLFLLPPKVGFGGGYSAGVLHKRLKNYENDNTFYLQFTVAGMVNLSFSQMDFLLKESVATPLGIEGIDDRESSLTHLSLAIDMPIPVFKPRENFFFAPVLHLTIPWTNYYWFNPYHSYLRGGGYSFSFGHENLTKLGLINLGNEIGIGFTLTLFKHINLHGIYCYQAIVPSSWKNVITAGVYGIYKDEMESLTEVRFGANLLF